MFHSGFFREFITHVVMFQAARINQVDPDGSRSGVSIRGASSATAKTKKLTAATVVREAVGTPLTTGVIDIWRDFVNRRYDHENKFLNLEVRNRCGIS